MARSQETFVDAGDRELRVSSPDRVIFPATERTPAHTKLRRDRRLISRSSRRIPGVRSIARNTPAFVRPYAAAITFSFTDMFRNRRNVWNVRAMPSWLMRNGFLPPIDLPANRTSPAVGAYTPVTTLKTVVLPAPFGPMSPTSSP